MSTPILGKKEYIAQTALTRDARMEWWRDAKFGMFIHYGLYALLGRNEWVQSREGIPQDEYAKLAERFQPKEGCCREWARLARRAGMKYAVLTTRHHEGFSLWNSKVNPYNSYNACGRDLVREFTEACREEGLKIGFYSSLMDWHHPDGAACEYDPAARRRFLDYIEALNTELLTNYGKIDILWYDVASPLDSADGWESVTRNQRLRALQPDIIINNRSCLDEDFGTPEGSIHVSDRDWEACMTFNDISWGYVDEAQSAAHAYTAPRILKMLETCAANGGNLLLNIGPAPDGSVPGDAVSPLLSVGDWLKRNGAAFYGKDRRLKSPRTPSGNGVSGCTQSADRKHVYIWNWIYPGKNGMGIGGYLSCPKKITFLATGEEIPFRFEPGRILLLRMPETCPDPLGVAVIDMEFEQEPDFKLYCNYPQISWHDV